MRVLGSVRMQQEGGVVRRERARERVVRNSAVVGALELRVRSVTAGNRGRYSSAVLRGSCRPCVAAREHERAAEHHAPHCFVKTFSSSSTSSRIGVACLAYCYVAFAALMRETSESVCCIANAP